MTTIDPSTNLGRLRLRVSDFSDLPLLPDSVYLQTLTDTNNNLPESARICAMYILGSLAQKTHRKLAQLEVWGAEAFASYKEFLLLTVTNPAFMSVSPIPYSSNAEYSPILSFQKAWNKSFIEGTEAQQLAFTGDLSANPDTRLGIYGYPYEPV